MKQFFLPPTVAIIMTFVFANVAHAQYNQKITIDLRETEHFTYPQNPNLDDKITVINTKNNNDFKITGWKFDDATRDTAAIELTGDTTADVIRRGGVGATYKLVGEYVYEKPTDKGIVDSFRRSPWWKAEDVTKSAISDALVLKDSVGGVAISDHGHGASASRLLCMRDANDKGHVDFKLYVEDGTYHWSVPSVDSDTWTEPDYNYSLSGIDPGPYTLTVTGDANFERKIDFHVSTVKLTNLTIATYLILDENDDPSVKFNKPVDFIKERIEQFIVDLWKKPIETMVAQAAGTTLKAAKWMGVAKLFLIQRRVRSVKMEAEFKAWQSDGTWQEGLQAEAHEEGSCSLLGLWIDPSSDLVELQKVYVDVAAELAVKIKDQADAVYE